MSTMMSRMDMPPGRGRGWLAAGLMAALLMTMGCGPSGPGGGPLDLRGTSLGSGHSIKAYAGLPDDPLLPSDAQIQSAWGLEVGAPDVVVAVIDTGIDWRHPDLKDVIWVNPGEDIDSDGLATSSDLDGVDNDGNGYVDDVIGWDFVEEDNDPMDTHGHGTSVSGVISAATDNGVGVAGHTWNCPVMVVRARPTLTTDYSRVAAGIRYAQEQGARVINLSLGGSQEPPSELREAIEAAYQEGILIVGSAGNQNHALPHYPDAYPEVMSVAAVDAQGEKRSSSNFGDEVEVCALAAHTTTLLGGDYGVVGGTSHATPCVAALGALLLSRYPLLTPAEVRAIISATADPIEDPNSEYAGMLGAGRINFLRALEDGY